MIIPNPDKPELNIVAGKRLSVRLEEIGCSSRRCPTIRWRPF